MVRGVHMPIFVVVKVVSVVVSVAWKDWSRS